MISLKNINLVKDKNQGKGKAKYIIDGGSFLVEESAIQHYNNLGFNAKWTENQFWQNFMIFYLWDNKIEGRGSVNDILEHLKTKDLEKFFIKSYDEHYINTWDINYKFSHYTCGWDKYRVEDFLIPVKFIEKYNLLKLIKRLAFKSSGLPDLMIFNERNFFLSEIKSENDRIRNNQMEWHYFLSEELKLNLEILLINHSQKKIENIKTLYKNKSFQI
jgi:hypothetical protein